MSETLLTPQTSVDELFLTGNLSKRAAKVLQQAGIADVQALARYHQTDPRYQTLGGCGKKTRRELNAAIKAAYGKLALPKSSTAPARDTRTGSWAERWAEAEAGDWTEIAPDSIAAAWEEEGTLTAAERRYYERCEAYHLLIRTCRGVPSTVEDIELHQWFLRQRQSQLGARRKALFNELCRHLD